RHEQSEDDHHNGQGELRLSPLSDQRTDESPDYCVDDVDDERDGDPGRRCFVSPGSEDYFRAECDKCTRETQERQHEHYDVRDDDRQDSATHELSPSSL